MQRLHGGSAAASLSGGAVKAAPATMNLPVGATVRSEIPLFSNDELNYDASVASKTWQQITPAQSVTVGNNVLLQVPASSVQGQYYAWNEAFIQFTASYAVGGTVGLQCRQPYFHSTALFGGRAPRVMINSVDVSESHENYSFWAQVARHFVTKPFIEPSVNALSATDSGYAFSGDSAYNGYQSPVLIGLDQSTTQDFASNAFRVPQSTLMKRLGLTNLDTYLPLRDLHPLFASNWLPSSLNVSIDLQKSSQDWQFSVALASGETLTVTAIDCSLWVPRYQLTAIAAQMESAALSRYNGILTYNCLRTSLSSFILGTGQTSFNFNLTVAKKPSFLALWMVPTSKTDVTRACTGSPLCPTFTGRPSIQSLRVDVAGTKYPLDNPISRNATGSGAAGGSALRDYLSYKDACKFAGMEEGIFPMLSNEALTSNDLCLYFINLNANGQQLDGMREIVPFFGNIGISLTLNAALAASYSLFAIGFDNVPIKVEPSTGRIEPW
jgi:hypothetical protein